MASSEVDIELAATFHPLRLPSMTWKSWLRPGLTSWGAFGSSYETADSPIEDYPAGYPRFSALVASHPSYHIVRRFALLRAQLLLLKQDRLSLLEERLTRFDSDKNNCLFLACSRSNTNDARRQILEDIDDAMADYDSFLDRHQKAMSLDMAPRRARADLKNWIDGVGCIARKETAYLDHAEDLVQVSTHGDSATNWFQSTVEEGRRLYHKHWIHGATADCPPSFPLISRDPHVHVFPISSTRQTVRILMALFVTILLIGPVIVCNIVKNLSARLVIVTIATSTFVSLLSGLTKASTVELIVAGATYTTVLVVFISNTDGSA